MTTHLTNRIRGPQLPPHILRQPRHHLGRRPLVVLDIRLRPACERDAGFKRVDLQKYKRKKPIVTFLETKTFPPVLLRFGGVKLQVQYRA